MLQARVLLCLSLAAVQVWAQGNGSSQSGTAFTCYQANPWWTFMNNTSGDSCRIALDMRRQAGLASLSTEASNQILMHPENRQLCLPVVYDMYGACLACQQDSPPANHMMPSYKNWCNLTSTSIDPETTKTIESLAPDWAKKVDFTDGVWDLDMVRTAALGSSPTTETAPPVPTATSGSGNTTPVAPSSSSSGKSNIGPIVGGVIGGLALISIGAAILFFYLRRQRNRKVAPSSEFTKYIHTGGTHMSTRPETALSGSRGTVPRQDSATIPLTAGEDEVLEAPPAFTPGQYTGPVFEKDGYRADPNNPVYSSGNAASQPSHSQNGPQGPSGAV